MINRIMKNSGNKAYRSYVIVATVNDTIKMS